MTGSRYCPLAHRRRAYDGYKFYLPAFLDFRGRVYRCGILHFHECDLARSLIVFADDNHYQEEIKCNSFIRDQILLSTFFHFKSFNSMVEAVDFVNNNKVDFVNN